MIELIAETGSTSADLASRLAAGEQVPEGWWLVADRQRAGRGRHGRTWLDGAGNFMGSTLVHLRTGDPPPHTLALVAGLAVHEAIREHVPGAWLKWPNDVVVDGGKLAGVLIEREGDTAIVGIGVNLVSAPAPAPAPAPAIAPAIAGFPATALADHAAPPSRDDFAAVLATALGAEIERWRGAGLAPLLARWEAAAHPLGTRLRIGAAGAELCGHFAGLDDRGALRLRLDDGSLVAVRGGEVRPETTEGPR